MNQQDNFDDNVSIVVQGELAGFVPDEDSDESRVLAEQKQKYQIGIFHFTKNCAFQKIWIRVGTNNEKLQVFENMFSMIFKTTICIVLYRERANEPMKHQIYCNLLSQETLRALICELFAKLGSVVENITRYQKFRFPFNLEIVSDLKSLSSKSQKRLERIRCLVPVNTCSPFSP